MEDSKLFTVELFYSLPRRLKVQQDKIIHECFGDSKDVAEGDKWCDEPYARLLAIERGKVIGNVTLVKRKIKYGGESIILGGIRGACTKKEKRGLGVAKALLKRAVQELKNKKCDIAFLGMNPNNKKLIRLYSNFGFVLLNRHFTYLGKSGKKYTENNGMLAKINSKSKFDYVMKSKSPFYIGVGAL